MQRREKVHLWEDVPLKKGICFSVREIENYHVHLPDKRNEKK
ncbi:hypothetical protein TFKS16_0331 [Tannerella forsythia KS16]|uniref:Uncharacterized protein n=1 Tax=Tannerella forsythia (strain ATCC 43037 / JCM 10827 / CCUG 21028 A / KCTC 5666 / FDC 338) TaxID=203275 RepID=G8UM09_TANFA|nr:hypothetical protein BFO_0612 [Tannerella forsythia 92A2]BAR50655.1 hypothetical protein TFKS16_0331 [Tannerella forsythia KS16]